MSSPDESELIVLDQVPNGHRKLDTIIELRHQFSQIIASSYNPSAVCIKERIGPSICIESVDGHFGLREVLDEKGDELSLNLVGCVHRYSKLGPYGNKEFATDEVKHPLSYSRREKDISSLICFL